MKKWLITIVVLILVGLTLVGTVTFHGRDQRCYETNVQLGRNDVIDQNYHDALNYFQAALKVNPNGTRAHQDADQTRSYVNGARDFTEQRLAFAARNYRRSIKLGALAALNRRSLVNYRLTTTLETSSPRLAAMYNQALGLNHRRQYTRSARELARLSARSPVRLSYFSGLRSRVRQLRRADVHRQRSSQLRLSSGLVGRSRNRFKLAKPVAKPVTSKVTVRQARHAIHRAGVNEQKMSNQDVDRLIRQAANHRASVYRYAKQNY